MVEYNVVKYCKLCKKRFIVSKKENYKYYCDECKARLDKAEE